MLDPLQLIKLIIIIMQKRFKRLWVNRSQMILHNRRAIPEIHIIRLEKLVRNVLPLLAIRSGLEIFLQINFIQQP
jgi:hypothetical protein